MDTSAIGKRYIPEIGSTWLKALTDPISGNVIVVSDITGVELHSALARRQREKRMAASDIANLRTDILVHMDTQYISVSVDKGVLSRAHDLVFRHSLRTLDAIQLASALDGTANLAEPFTFVSADTDLLSAAASEGFAVDNPLSHP